MKKRDTILTIDGVEPGLVSAVNRLAQEFGVPLKGLVLVTPAYAKLENRPRDTTGLFEEIICDFDNPDVLQTTLHPYADRLLLATCRFEFSIQPFRQVLPFIPYVKTPTETSLLWATEKHLMRDRLHCYNETLIPQYRLLTSYDLATVQEIVQNMTFPMIVKPNGLAQSLLVTQVTNETELHICLEDTFRVLRDVYIREYRKSEPSLLVEEVIPGELYSTDAYVNEVGDIVCLPLVKVVTAHEVSLPGFYSLETVSPVSLPESEIAAAMIAAESTIKALNLRSTTTHIEMHHNESGWKIIELGARIGGYREVIYREAYGIDHYYNDLRTHLGLAPEVSLQPIGNAAVINIYGEKEGIFTAIDGIEAAKQLSSVIALSIDLPLGHMSLFASKGGLSIVNCTLRNEDPEVLRADIARVRELIKITITPVDMEQNILAASGTPDTIE